MVHGIAAHGDAHLEESPRVVGRELQGYELRDARFFLRRGRQLLELVQPRRDGGDEHHHGEHGNRQPHQPHYDKPAPTHGRNYRDEGFLMMH